VLFVGLVKAYDAVNREMLWKILKILGVPDNLIMVLKKLYGTRMLRSTSMLGRYLNSSSLQAESVRNTHYYVSIPVQYMYKSDKIQDVWTALRTV
jgi:hypothetical protein